MRRLTASILACAVGLASCVIPSHGTRPQPVPGEADTFRFRVFPSAVVMEGTFADRAAEDEIDKFRQANGYASSSIVARDPVDNAYVYTVRFAR